MPAPPIRRGASNKYANPIEILAPLALSQNACEHNTSWYNSESGGSESYSEKEAYSVFTRTEKNLIVGMSGLGGFFSPLAANTYLPAIPIISTDLHVSVTLVYLTVTVFMIVQGIAPSIFGDLADISGRRPAYLISFLLFIAANLGLALQDSYPALILLRCLQSVGSSTMYALNSGVVADVSTTAERGKYMGAAQSGISLGPALAPAIGGILVQYFGWRSIFWFLLAFGALYILVFAVFMPETARNVVGDGSFPPIRPWNKSLYSVITQRRELKRNKSACQKKLDEAKRLAKENSTHIPNPINVFRIIFEKEMAVLLVYNSFIYASWYSVTASVSTEYPRNYSLDTLQVGLCYIPIGVGAALSIILNGRLQDYNYKRTARKHNKSISQKGDDDLTNFPIEEARLSLVASFVYVGAAAVIGFGWTLNQKAPLPVLLTLTFILTFFFTAVCNSMNLLLVDLFPQSPASASAATNLWRCLFGAAGVAIIDPLIDALGQSWSFTLVGCLVFLFSPAVFVLMKCGQKWRTEKRMKERLKEPDKHDSSV